MRSVYGYKLCLLICLQITAAVTAQSVEGDATIGDVSLSTISSFPIRILGPSNVTLPADRVQLEVEVEKNEVLFRNTSLSFTWEVVSGDGLATAEAYNRKRIVLTQLKPGSMVFRVVVGGQNLTSHTEHSLQISEKVAMSYPPRAVIRPDGPIYSVEGNTLTLDAEGSNITALPAEFHWVQISGPTVTLPATNVPSLRIEKLIKGSYKFRVTVTDSKRRQDTATVEVNVSAERDDPPKARITECGLAGATDTVTLRLPLDRVELCANNSQDDKGIVEYRWYRVDDLGQQLTVDLEGSSTPVLLLKNLQPNEKFGAYEFSLDVFDEKKQKDSAKVSVFVHAAHNMPPVADAGGNRTVILPESSLVLEGNAHDDGQIRSYSWSQLSGPTNATVLNANQAKATASALSEGVYLFRLNVVDDGGLNGSDYIWVSVERGQNKPPSAVADNVTVSLPMSVVVLDGSRSFDDAGIVAYFWEPDDDVPAAVEILGDSSKKDRLMLGRLIEGTFKFNFTVRDQQGESDQKWVWLYVEKGDAEVESVEIFLRQNLAGFSHLQRAKLENRISAVLSSGTKDLSIVRVHTTTVEEEAGSGRVRLVLWAEAVEQTAEMRRSTRSKVIAAEEIVTVLRAEATMQRNFLIEGIETRYCKLSCSNHGHCSDHSKECICDRFWMPSLIGMLFSGGRKDDCAWSSVYFFISTVVLTVFSIYCICIKRSPRRWTKRARRLRRRRRYSPLHSEESDDERKFGKNLQRVRNAPRLQPLPLPPSSDSLHSESDDLLPHGVVVGSQSIELRGRGR